jgi:GT2 family glycosyltransferase
MISICIPCYCGAARLARLLQSLKAVDPVGPYCPAPNDLELLVYDDGSPSEAAEEIARVFDAFPAVTASIRKKRLIRGEQNLGAVGALREITRVAASEPRGWSAASGTSSCILQLDDDVVLPFGFFGTLRELLAIPNVGVLSWRSEGTRPGQSRRPVQGMLQPATELSGYCMAYRCDVSDEVGGIDTRYKFACSDSDFALRVALAGHPCYRVWWPLVLHAEHGSMGDPAVRAETARQDVAAFFAKWGASGQEMERRALARLWEC